MSQPSGPQRSIGSKAMRFAMVGIANTIIDLIVFALLLGAGALPLLANAGAWLVAVSFSYIVNSRWSFERDASLSHATSILRFMALGALISLGVSSGFIAVTTGWIGVWPAKIAGVAVAMVLNFFAARWSIENRART